MSESELVFVMELGDPREAHSMCVGRCASDLWLWARWALRVVQRSVVTLRVAQWSVVALRDGCLFFMQLDVSFGRCVQDVFFES